MGFENRGNQKYYYRKHRRNGTCHSEYIGIGEFARLIAQLDSIEREQKKLELLEFQESLQREDEIDTQLQELSGVIKSITGMCLIVSGYHQHKRQWRKWQKRQN